VAHAAGLARFEHRAEGLGQRDLAAGPVDQQQVDVLGAQVAQRTLDLVVDADRPELRVPQLRFRNTSSGG